MDRVLMGLLLAKLVLHAVSAVGFEYGIMGDEAYYLACARRLDLAYVDHPSFSILLLRGLTQVFGDGLLVLRGVPAIFGALTMWLTADLARQMGAGRAGARLAAAAVLTSPVFMSLSAFYSMNAIDGAVWVGATTLWVRCLTRPSAGRWAMLGVVLAVGLFNKLSVLWLGFGFTVAMGIGNRASFRERGAWGAAFLGLTGLLPVLIWNAGHDWATLDFIRNGSAEKLEAVTPWGFLAGQLVVVGPHLAPLWIGGLVGLLFASWARAFRGTAWVWLAVLAVLLLQGHVRSYYLAAAYPPLFAAGAVGLERWISARWTGLATGGVCAIGVALAPLAIPLLPVESFFRYEAMLGLSAPVDQAEARETPLPLHFATKLPGPPVIEGVREALATLEPDERARAVVLSRNYTEAALIEHLGEAEGIRSVSVHNSYWFWGPGEPTEGPWLVLADPGDAILESFEDCEPAGSIDCELCMGFIHDTVTVCRGQSTPLSQAWRGLQKFR